jgi:glycosyltransferase involved in cell wall biosynthesis
MEGGYRVLMITTGWPAPDGTSQFIKRQAEFLQAAGVDLDVFYFRAKKNVLSYVRAWFEVRRRLRSGRYDLIHAQYGQSGLMALPKRLPYVVTLRGCDLLGTVSDIDGRYTWMGRLNQFLTRAVAARADAVILVSAHMKESLGRSRRTYVIPSGINFDLFKPIPQDEARERLGFGKDEKLILFVGNPEQARKRFALAKTAVDVLNKRMPARLVIGWGVRHTDIPVYMSACNALLFTSMQEGSPNVVKESLACNLPVVSVPVGDVGERIGKVEGCELVRDESPDAIAAALERVVGREARVDGRSAVMHLSETMTTQKVISIYQTILAEQPSPSALRRPATAGSGSIAQPENRAVT